MKALILAAGYGTRLYPLTKNQPKPLLKIGSKLMIEHIIDKINEVKEITDILIITNDKFYPNFVDWSKKFKQTEKNIAILNDKTKTNEERLGAVGDIYFAIKETKIDDDILVIGGDNLFEFSLKSFFDFSRRNKRSAIAVRDLGQKQKLAKKFGVVEVDKNNKLISFEEKPETPKSTLASTCCYLFTKEDIQEFKKCLEENKKPDNTGDFIRYLSEKKPVYAFIFKERWFDIGSIEQLEEANKTYREL
jgi:glucose-1-phosphate thymidylyltransferase